MKTEQWAQQAMVALLRTRLSYPVTAEWNEARLAFLTHLSHELRTPVTALKLALESLCDELRSGMTRQQAQQAEICLRNVDRIVEVFEGRIRELDENLAGDEATCQPGLFLPVD